MCSRYRSEAETISKRLSVHCSVLTSERALFSLKVSTLRPLVLQTNVTLRQRSLRRVSGNILVEQYDGNRRDPCPSATFSTANFTWIGPRLNTASAIRYHRLHGLEISVSIFSLTPPRSTENFLRGGDLNVRETVHAGQNQTPESRFISKFLLLNTAYHHFISSAYLSTRVQEAQFGDLVIRTSACQDKSAEYDWSCSQNS